MYNIYKGRGLSGLYNLGNTCFINSCFQVLSHTYELNDLLNDEDILKRLNNICDSILLIEWKFLNKALWDNNCKIKPTRFIDVIQKISKIKNIELFTGFLQNDITEFIIFVINCFHNSLSRKVSIYITGEVRDERDKIAKCCYDSIKNIYSNEYSEIWNMFYAISISIISNKDTCDKINMKAEPYSILSLSIPTNNKQYIDIYDCFNLYIQDEIIEGYYYEDINKKIDVKKTLLFWSFPTILIIDLKRYSINSKNNILVHFPLENLNLSEYIIGYDKNTYIYDLYAVCNHNGNIEEGHYTTYIKNIDKWYLFDDDKIYHIENLNDIISHNAYCLFFRKKNKYQF